MQKLQFLLLGSLAVLPLCTFGAVDVDFSSGKFSSDGQHMVTGKNGHAEAVLDAQGSLIRFGSNTQADVGNEREVTLSKGLLLVSSGEGFLRRSGVVIHTPEGNITVRGTVLVAVLPDGAVKLTCLEGGVRGDLGGQGFSLHPGELIIQRGDSTRDIVQVNLHSLAGSCALLVGDGFKPLHFAGNIDQAVAQQDKVFVAEHHLAAGQHVAGHGQGDSSSFLARLFSWNSNATNNTGGSTGGATFAISQGGTFNSATTISSASSTLALSGNTSSAMMGSAPVMGAGALAISGSVSANPPEAALLTATPPQQLLLISSGGTTTDPNNNNSSTSSTSSLTISGSTFTGGATFMSGSSNAFYTGVTSSISGGATLVIANPGLTLGQVNTANLISTNANIVGGTLNLNAGITTTSGGDVIYNGQVYHGQDAVNLINSLQHSTHPSTP